MYTIDFDNSVDLKALPHIRVIDSRFRYILADHRRV